MEQVNDRSTPVEILKDAIRRFAAERQWQKYHNPKNLAISIGVESGELMQVFQWISPDTAKQIEKRSKRWEKVAEELSDVVIYCLMLAMALDIDITTAVLTKIERNAAKYPADEYKGEYRRPDN
jgi:NTP pyrophosphatase (non-canonical NTP hydrolase)